MKTRISINGAMYLVAALGTVALLISAYTTNSFFDMLPYLFLPVGLLFPEFLIPTYFIASLSSNFFMASEGIGFTRLLALVIIAGVVLRLIRGKKFLKKKWIIIYLFIAISTFISSLLAYDSSLNPLMVIGLNILILIALTNMLLDRDRLVNVFQSILIAVFIATLFYSVNFILNPDFLDSGRLSIAEGINENRYGMMMAQMSAFCLAYMFYTKRKLAKIFCLAAGFINAYFVLLSGSRSALIGLVFGFLLAVVISSYKQNKLNKRLLSITVISAIAAMIFYSVIELYPTLAHRMNIDQVISTGGTRRWPRVIAEIQYVIPSHLFFGVGPSSINETIALSRFMSDPGSSHNIIVSALTQLGVVGFIAYMSFYWNVIKETISKVGEMQILIIPLMLILTALFNGIGEVMYSERLFWNALALAGLCLSVQTNRNMLKTSQLLSNAKQSDETMMIK